MCVHVEVRGQLLVSHWSGTSQVGWAGPLVTPRDPPVSASLVLGLQVSTTTPGFLHVGSETRTQFFSAFLTELTR